MKREEARRGNGNAVWKYRNPVQIVFGAGSFDELRNLLNGRSYAVATYPEPFFASLIGKLSKQAGAPLLVIDDVAPNPDTVLLAAQTLRFRALPVLPEVVVAIGGGSVIDSAKVFAAARGDFGAVDRFLRTKVGGETLAPIPLIAVPTTAGTGSEVTSWGTVWDTQGGKKFSLAHPDLYPSYAVVDPALMLAKPKALTISTGLDALSHALESLWNVNANPVSANHAVAAAREVIEVLPPLVNDLGNLELRTRMAKAAMFAGLAFSNTATAIAHSMSYPITLAHNVPHGIACSFSLPFVLRSVIGCGGLCEDALRRIFGPDLEKGARELEALITSLGVSTSPQSYGITPAEWLALVGEAFGGDRGRNFLGSKEKLLAASVDRKERSFA